MDETRVSEVDGTPDQPFYSIISSYTIRPSDIFLVAVSLHRANSKCVFKIALKGPQYDAKQFVKVQPNSTEFVKFYVPEIREGDYRLIVNGIEGITVLKSTPLLFQDNDPVVFIQRDRAIYRPGDLVQFRVLVMDDKTHPIIIEKPINIMISDSKQNCLKQWKNVEFKTGVYCGKFKLSEYAGLGDWQIDVTMEGQTLKTAFFEVDKYILPKFSASVETEDVAIFDGIVHVTVRSQYTYGKGVNGKATVCIRPRYGKKDENVGAEKTFNVENGKGEVKFKIGHDFSVERERDHYMAIIATMEEEFTGNTVEATANLTLHSQRFRFEGIDNPYEFHPCKFLTIRIAVKTFDGKPVLRSRHPLKLIIEKKRNFLGVDEEEKNNDESNVVGELEEKLDKRGIATFRYKFPGGEHNFYYLKCRYLECESHILTVSKYVPPEPVEFIQPEPLEVRVLTQNPKLKEPVEVEVKSGEDLSYFIYTIHARGRLLTTQFVSLPEKTKEYIIKITPTFEMIPYASVFVHYVVGNELKYADASISFDREFENFIDIYAPIETSPGQRTEIRLHTNPDSYIGVLGVDQSVLLHRSGNDLDTNDVFDTLGRFDNATASRPSEARCPGENSGLVTITNANYPVYDLPSIIMMSSPMPIGKSLELESIAYCEDDATPGDMDLQLAPKPKIRKEFPETWIFDDIECINSNCYVLNKNAPDTITSWILTAFSMNPKSGLAITKNPSMIRSFRPFFISTSLPYSVKRGEEVTIPVVVFNYMDQDCKTAVKLDNTDDEYDILDLCPMKTECTKGMTIASGSGESVNFTIRPKCIGCITLKLLAFCPVASDRVHLKLRVESEGVRIFKSRDYFLQSRAALVDIHNEVKLDIPQDIVPDSLLIEATVMGNILSSTIRNIDNLVRKPCGCGEQIMVHFAASIFTLWYLDSIRELTKPLEVKAKRFLEIGYQSELSYKHDDGSYSAFGKSDARGSTWLTAYVVRCFHQAKKYINIDPKVVEQGLNFLAKTQAANGSFPELGHVFDSAHMNEVAMTSFVLLAFLENTELMGHYEKTIDRGFNFIQNNIRGTTDVFALAISAYAMQMRKLEGVQDILEKLETAQQINGPYKYWTKEDKHKKDAQECWLVPSHDVEITGYIVLTLLDLNIPVLSVIRWLLSRRNSNGGFGSTQDTVVGLWALVKFAEKNGIGINVDMGIEIVMPEDVHPIKKFNVNKGNALLTQTFELPKRTRSLIYSARGTGTALLQISYSYYVEEKEIKSIFSLSAKEKPAPTPSIMAMEIFVEFTPEHKKRNPKSNMAVMEITLPSGYTAIEASLNRIQEIENVKRVETKNGDECIIVYFDNLRVSDQKCIPVEAELTHAVTGQKPVPIVIYDYYDNEKRATEFFQLDGSTMEK